MIEILSEKPGVTVVKDHDWLVWVTKKHSSLEIANIERHVYERLATNEHPCLLGYRGAEGTDIHLLEVPGCTLYDLLTGPSTHPDSKDTELWIMLLALTLTYIHQKNICHGDLKSDNILFGEDDIPRLVGFSSAKIGDYPLPETAEESHAPPDVRQADKLLDIRDFGYIIYDVLFKHAAFDGHLNNEEDDYYLANGFPESLGFLGTVISKCWLLDYGSAGDLVLDLEKALPDVDPGALLDAYSFVSIA